KISIWRCCRRKKPTSFCLPGHRSSSSAPLARQGTLWRPGREASATYRKYPPMHLAIFSYNVDYGPRPDQLARAQEERGFESFWVGEHTHIPASRQTPYPGGEPLPRPYYHMADPFVSLMAAAAATTTIKLGTGVCLVVEHDPIVLAKTVATLDWLSQ